MFESDEAVGSLDSIDRGAIDEGRSDSFSNDRPVYSAVRENVREGRRDSRFRLCSDLKMPRGFPLTKPPVGIALVVLCVRLSICRGLLKERQSAKD